MYYTESYGTYYAYYADGILFGIFNTEWECREAISKEMEERNA